MTRKKFVHLYVLIISLMLITTLFRVCSVKGESIYSTEYDSNSKTLTVRNQQGRYLVSLYMMGYSIGDEIAVDSSKSTIYFTTYDGKYYSSNCYLYSYDLNTGQYSLMCKLPGIFYSYDVKELYDGSLYLNGWNPSDNTAMYRYQFRNHSLQKIADVGYVQRYKKNIIMDWTHTMGSFSPYPLYVYNTKTNKVRQVTKYCGGWSRVGQWVYYAKLNGDSTNSTYTYSIKKYSLSSMKTKNLLKKLSAFIVGRITAKKIYYTSSYGMQANVCTIKGKNKKKISMQQYYKACQSK